MYNKFNIKTYNKLIYEYYKLGLNFEIYINGVFSLFYILIIFLVYLNAILSELFIDNYLIEILINEYLLEMKGREKYNFYKSEGPEDGWDPNNFNTNFYITKENEKPYPKNYILPGGYIIPEDDRLTHLELNKRIYYTKIVKIFNNKIFDHSIKFSENFFKSYSTISAINIKLNLISNPDILVKTYQKQGILAKIDAPILPSYRMFASLSYASFIEMNDTMKEVFHGKPYPHSDMTKIIKASTPYTKNTFYENDTWDKDINVNILLNNHKKEARRQMIEKCEIF